MNESVTTAARVERLAERRRTLEAELIVVRGEFLRLRARKNHLEAQVSQITTEIDLINQGQLMLGDMAEGA